MIYTEDRKLKAKVYDNKGKLGLEYILDDEVGTVNWASSCDIYDGKYAYVTYTKS